MCGICGIVDLSGREVHAAELGAMVRTLRHRGPDGEGLHIEPGVGLGHTRLAVLDLETGAQPMSTADGRLTVIFNGEIYNYLELRTQLEGLGHRFHTQSDTETILAAYDQWGLDCQTRFNGMWAFALWDRPRRRLMLSRDRLGEKPLHYASANGRLVFGSEIKAVVAAGVAVEPRTDLLEVYLSLGTIPAPDTYYRNIYKLRPGHCLLVSGEGIRDQAYWRLPVATETSLERNQASVCARFSELFSDAVRLRMRSDVPLGAFLSGGLDSASVVAAMADQSPEPVHTFTVGFPQREFDERHLASLVAERFGTRHRELTVSDEGLGEALAATLRHYDEPFGDSSAIPTGAVAREARRFVTVVLTGDGGDEVLSGYTAYQGARFAEGYQQLPRAVRRLLPRFLARAAAPFSGPIRYRLNRAHRVVESSDLPPDAWLIAKFTGGNLPLIESVLRDYPHRVRIADYMARALEACPYHGHFYRRMFFDLNILLPDDMLMKVDRMSMAWALECRLPFLDYRIVELLALADRSVKMKGFSRKTVLRRTVGRRLPAALLRAPKRGFGAPIREWFKRPQIPEFDALAANAAGLNPQAVQECVAANREGRRDLGNFIWTLLVLNTWHGARPVPALATVP